MDHSDDDPQELKRKIEQADRIAAGIADQTTVQRLREFVEDLKGKLRRRLATRRRHDEIKSRANQIWNQKGRPEGRDLEFWLQAEDEISSRES